MSDNYDRIGKFKISDVLPFVVMTANGIVTKYIKRKKENKRRYMGYWVKMCSQRYQLFKSKGVVCVKCGVEGKYFALERHKGQRGPKKYHFNLYAIDKGGNEVMLTKDHIIPRSKGGPDTLSNYQVMCLRCNNKKGNGYHQKKKES